MKPPAAGAGGVDLHQTVSTGLEECGRLKGNPEPGM